jgi:hypothetical protein
MDVICFDKYRGYLLNKYILKEFQREIAPSPHTHAKKKTKEYMQ